MLQVMLTVPYYQLDRFHSLESINNNIVLLLLMTMTTLIAAMQDSLLTLESSTKTGWKTHESLRGTHPQGIAFDPRNSNNAYCGTFGDGLDFGRQMMVERFGIALERMVVVYPAKM
jgi:hypothetical protein